MEVIAAHEIAVAVEVDADSYRAPHRGQPRWFEKRRSVAMETGAGTTSLSCFGCDRVAVRGSEAAKQNMRAKEVKGRP